MRYDHHLQAPRCIRNGLGRVRDADGNRFAQSVCLLSSLLAKANLAPHRNGQTTSRSTDDARQHARASRARAHRLWPSRCVSALHHWAIDCRGPLSYGWVEDFVIDDFSGATLSHRWCDGYLLKL